MKPIMVCASSAIICRRCSPSSQWLSVAPIPTATQAQHLEGIMTRMLGITQETEGAAVAPPVAADLHVMWMANMHSMFLTQR